MTDFAGLDCSKQVIINNKQVKLRVNMHVRGWQICVIIDFLNEFFKVLLNHALSLDSIYYHSCLLLIELAINVPLCDKEALRVRLGICWLINFLHKIWLSKTRQFKRVLFLISSVTQTDAVLVIILEELLSSRSRLVYPYV